MKNKRIQIKFWNGFLFLSLCLGILLRIVFVDDMEYKEDEEYNFNLSQWIGSVQPWPWYGMPSGVYVLNPGMSIWVFAALAKAFHLTSPTSLARGVQLFAVLGMSLVLLFAHFSLQGSEKKQWQWAFALAMVNPFLILYQRKLWPEPFLPFFTVLSIAAWWHRARNLGAFFWGFVGALIGQIHMSGFFFSFALFLWTLLFDPKRRSVAWRAWFLGSCLGAAPLLPWLYAVYRQTLPAHFTQGWGEIVQLKYWTFWFTDPTGLHLGNPLGLLRGNSHWDQISDFVRYPLILGYPSYLCGLAHAMALIASTWILMKGFRGIFQVVLKGRLRTLISFFLGTGSQTAFVQNSALWGCGMILTATGVLIKRFYMCVTFPLEFICFVRMANPETKNGTRFLFLLWVALFLISLFFVIYIHANQGSIWGDYGKAYHLLKPGSR